MCKSRMTCHGACGLGLSSHHSLEMSRVCACDSLCTLHHDCCSDFHLKCPEISSRSQELSHLSRVSQSRRECVDNFIVISSCPQVKSQNTNVEKDASKRVTTEDTSQRHIKGSDNRRIRSNSQLITRKNTNSKGTQNMGVRNVQGKTSRISQRGGKERSSLKGINQTKSQITRKLEWLPDMTPDFRGNKQFSETRKKTQSKGISQKHKDDKFSNRSDRNLQDDDLFNQFETTTKEHHYENTTFSEHEETTLYPYEKTTARDNQNKTHQDLDNSRWRHSESSSVETREPDHVISRDNLMVTDVRDGLSYTNLSIYVCNNVDADTKDDLKLWFHLYTSSGPFRNEDLENYLTQRPFSKSFYDNLHMRPPEGVFPRLCRSKQLPFSCYSACSRLESNFEDTCGTLLRHKSNELTGSKLGLGLDLTTEEQLEITTTSGFCRIEFPKIMARTAHQFNAILNLESFSAKIHTQQKVYNGWNHLSCMFPVEHHDRCQLVFSCVNGDVFINEIKQCLKVQALWIKIDYDEINSHTQLQETARNYRLRFLVQLKKQISFQKSSSLDKCTNMTICPSYVFLEEAHTIDTSLNFSRVLDITLQVLNVKGVSLTACYIISYAEIPGIWHDLSPSQLLRCDTFKTAEQQVKGQASRTSESSHDLLMMIIICTVILYVNTSYWTSI